MSLPIPKAGRFECAAFLDFVRSRPCKKCGEYGVDPHHYPSTGSRGGWRGARDDSAIPLCRPHHDDAQEYKIPAEDQERWVLEVRSEFLELATDAQLLGFFDARRRWAESRLMVVL